LAASIARDATFGPKRRNPLIRALAAQNPIVDASGIK
jgi:hypothetical protein